MMKLKNFKTELFIIIHILRLVHKCDGHVILKANQIAWKNRKEMSMHPERAYKYTWFYSAYSDFIPKYIYFFVIEEISLIFVWDIYLWNNREIFSL